MADFLHFFLYMYLIILFFRRVFSLPVRKAFNIVWFYVLLKQSLVFIAIVIILVSREWKHFGVSIRFPLSSSTICYAWRRVFCAINRNAWSTPCAEWWEWVLWIHWSEWALGWVGSIEVTAVQESPTPKVLLFMASVTNCNPRNMKWKSQK